MKAKEKRLLFSKTLKAYEEKNNNRRIYNTNKNKSSHYMMLSTQAYYQGLIETIEILGLTQEYYKFKENNK